MKLDQAIENSSGSDGHQQQGLTDEFIKKLREWEGMNEMREEGDTTMHKRTLSDKQVGYMYAVHF